MLFAEEKIRAEVKAQLESMVQTDQAEVKSSFSVQGDARVVSKLDQEMPQANEAIETKFPEVKVPQGKAEKEDVNSKSNETESMAKLKKYLRAKSNN